MDPTQNVVVFELDREFRENAAAGAPAMADDCVRQAWDTVRLDGHVRADEVTALYSDWEPSVADARFIAETFPTAEVSYSFRRPEPSGWEEAFAEARRLMAEASRQEGDDVEQAGELLPIVWSDAAPFCLLEALPHRRLIPDTLAVATAWVAPTPRGTIGMDHLTYHTQREIGDLTVEDLLDIAFDNLRTGLRIEGERSELGDLVTMHRPGSLAAAAVALPDFHERLSDILSDDRLVVGLPCQEYLLVTGAGSTELVEHVKEAVLSSPHAPGELLPTVLLVERTGMRLLVGP
jgi:hypothetical protein